MTLNEKIEKLQDLSRRFHDLMREPEPGIGAWHMMVGSILTEISEYAPEPVPEQKR